MPTAGAIVSGEAPAKAAGGTGRRDGPLGLDAMEVDIRANIPIDQCLPVGGCSDNADTRLGGSAADVDELCLEAKHCLVHGHAAERDANGDAVRSRGT